MKKFNFWIHKPIHHIQVSNHTLEQQRRNDLTLIRLLEIAPYKYHPISRFNK